MSFTSLLPPPPRLIKFRIFNDGAINLFYMYLDMNIGKWLDQTGQMTASNAFMCFFQNFNSGFNIFFPEHVP